MSIYSRKCVLELTGTAMREAYCDLLVGRIDDGFSTCLDGPGISRNKGGWQEWRVKTGRNTSLYRISEDQIVLDHCTESSAN